jgi:hypothetical protein
MTPELREEEKTCLAGGDEELKTWGVGWDEKG